MMFITDLKAISPQRTYGDEFLQGEKIAHSDQVYSVIEPDYMELIPRGLLRRMGKAVRMGVGTGLPLIKSHADIDGIIMGTANGGLEDCIKFLNQIVEYEEGVLTPTNFVQSTPNAVAGQLALMGSNRGYNTTYTNGGLSFENALLDALMLFEENNAKKLLIGGLEEISDYNYNIDSLTGKYKKEIVADSELLTSTTEGTVCGEGSAMFITEKDSSNYFAQIVDVEQVSYPSQSDLRYCLDNLLERNSIQHSDIDTCLLGYNGDIRHNLWYDTIANVFPNANKLTFKNLIGDYRSCSSFATWLGAHLISGNDTFLPLISKEVIHNNPIKSMLIYNHFDGIRHGFILLQK